MRNQICHEESIDLLGDLNSDFDILTHWGIQLQQSDVQPLLCTKRTFLIFPDWRLGMDEPVLLD